MKEIIENAINRNIELITKIDEVDWDVITRAETTVLKTLEEFQQTVDALYESIKGDVKRWREEMVGLSAKSENNMLHSRNLYFLIQCLKERLF